MSDSSPATQARKLPKDLAAEKGMVNVQIDGVWHQVPKGTKILEACRSVGTIIPHYCYHPKLSSPGSCRMCMVQIGMPPRPSPGSEPEYDEAGFLPIQWMPRPTISCANTVVENMGVRTSGELVDGCRSSTLEFLLANHPLDCPICDKAGECRLQELAVSYGPGSSRYLESKTKKPKNVEIGPRVRLDDERCILCSRCIRFMEEIAGDPVLGFVQRGGQTRLSVHPGRLLDSNYSLNTVDLCPVGALTSTDFRFQMRVWFLKETPSIDVNCGTGCNITIWTRQNKIHRITPRQNEDVNSWWMPDSHRLNFHYIDSPERLDTPLVRNDDEKPAPAAWSEALAAAAKGLKGRKPAEIAVIASGRMTNEELLLAKRIADALGTENLAVVPRTGEADGLLVSADRNPNTTGAKLVWKSKDPAAKLDTIRKGVASGEIKAVLSLHEDLTRQAGFSADDLKNLDFLAVTALLAGPGTEAADVVLPGAAFAEKRGSMVNITGRLQRLNQAVQAPGEARDDWEILAGLLAELGHGDDSLRTIDDVFALLAAGISEFKDLTLAKIGDLGVSITETGEKIPLLEKKL